MVGLDNVLDVAARVMGLNQILFLREAGDFARIEASVDVGGAIAFRADFLLVVAEALVQVLRLTDVLGNPLSGGAELTEDVVARLLLEVGADRVNVVCVGFAGLAGPWVCCCCSGHVGGLVWMEGWMPFPLISNSARANLPTSHSWRFVSTESSGWSCSLVGQDHFSRARANLYHGFVEIANLKKRTLLNCADA